MLREQLPKLSTLQILGAGILYIAEPYSVVLPQLRHLECCVGHDQLQGILQMPHVIFASLRVYCDLTLQDFQVNVHANSKLKYLKLNLSPQGARLQLSVSQPLLSYCDTVQRHGMVVKHNFDKAVYAAPVLFSD